MTEPGRAALVSPVRQRVVRWLLWSALAVHGAVALVAVVKSRLPQPDFDNYYRIGTRPGRPYADFAVEFPIGTTEAFRKLAPPAGTRERFGVDLVTINVAADVVIVTALDWGWGLEAAACFAVVVAPIVDLFFLRTDLWSAALATVGVAAWRRKRLVPAAVALVTGAAFKLWPIVLLPILVRDHVRRWCVPLAAAAVAGIAMLGWWLWVSGSQGIYEVITFRGARGWEVESTIGSLWMLGTRTSMRHESGAWRIGTANTALVVALSTVGAGAAMWMAWRGARTGRVGAGWAGGISALLVSSALLSPQFACWLAPAAGVAWVDGDALVAALTALAVFLTNLEFKSFVPLLRGESGALTLVLARNLLLVVLAGTVLRLLTRAPSRMEREGFSRASR